MDLSFSPLNLVRLLQQREPSARLLLDRLCREPARRLIERLIDGEQSGRDGAGLVDRTLRWQEMYLRSRESGEFEGMSRERFLAQLLAATFKMLAPVKSGVASALDHKGEPGAWQNPSHAGDGARHEADRGGIPGSSSFSVRTYALPLERVGGDWVGLKREDDGNLWIFLTDVTGHGFPAHIISKGLSYLWETRAIAERRSKACAPGELLTDLGRALEKVLPETVFVEAALVCLTPSGRAWASGAGNCRLLLRKSGHPRFDLHRLGGCWLGVGLEVHDQRDWKLDAGDEFLLASDGLYEQPDGAGQHLELTLDALVGTRLASGRALHDAILDTLEETLDGSPQRDDILVVTVCLHERLPAGQSLGHVGV